MEFYQNFVVEASTIDSDAIGQAYTDVVNFRVKGEDINASKERMLTRFDELNPELFSQIAVEYGTHAQVASVYVNILQLSLATEGREVIVEFPLDSIKKEKDEELGIMVYTIDRADITTALPIGATNFITIPEDRTKLEPIRIYKNDKNEFQLIPDKFSLSEIGTLKGTSPEQSENVEEAETTPVG